MFARTAAATKRRVHLIVLVGGRPKQLGRKRGARIRARPARPPTQHRAQGITLTTTSAAEEDTAIDICVLYETVDSPWGGANQFLKALASELIRMGHSVSRHPAPATQVVLINAFNQGPGQQLRPGEVAQLRHSGKITPAGRVLPKSCYTWRRRKGPPLIHRIDRVPELARGHRTSADDIQPAVNRLTDHTIFQTDYCRSIFAEHCGVTPSSWRVIGNAVDPKLFFPNRDGAWKGGPLRLFAASWSSNPRKGYEALAEISRLPDTELTFVGNWCPDVDPAGTRLLGVRRSDEVAELMRSSHALAHAGWNEACSNTIVEAMACGLPVIYRNSGGSPEQAADYGVPLTDSPSDSLNDLRNYYDHVRGKVLQDRDAFLIHRAANDYLSLFRHAVAKRQGT